ncbi:MAG: nitrilase-related carbon-nitrogen hydrolase, partial [Planctomycetota bacterium]|jgi:predicted amidohydrolase
VQPGGEVVVATVRRRTFGLSICYDLRFPELYRELAGRGAEILFVPSAFTLQTGRDHWEVLLRARAIENLAYVVAPNQFGPHPPDKRCYGHSMIVDPWGTVLCQVADGVGMALADVDLARLTEIRRTLPALDHQLLGR